MTEPQQLSRDHFGSSWVGIVSYYIFHWRKPLLAIFTLVTVALALSATRLEVQAGFNKMLPLEHPYMKTFLKYRDEFGGANRVLVAVRARKGDVFNPRAMAKLKAVHDEVFFVRGAERTSVLSLYATPAIFMEVVEDGFRFGPVLPSNFDGSPAAFATMRANLLKSQWIGRLVASDFSAAMVSVTLLDNDPEGGGRLDLRRVGAELEKIRAKHEDADFEVNIIGFAKATSDIAGGAAGVLLFFGAAALITAALLLWYSGSLMLTALALVVALVPVVWLLGLLPLLGLKLDPLSILVPFLIFSIGVSHAVQMTNAWKLETLRGVDGVSAARISFVKLFIPGASALLANGIGFLVIAFVKIEIVQELVLTATLGVSLMILTNKVLLPILLSYNRLSAKDAQKLHGREGIGDPLWRRISVIARPKYALPVLAIAVASLGAGLWKAQYQVIGDLGRGVPELRPDSRYNRDVEGITKRFAIGIDVLQVIAEGKEAGACTRFEVLEAVDRFEFMMRQTAGVQSVRGLAGVVKEATVGFSEGDVKWVAIPDTKEQRNQAVGFATRGTDLVNRDCAVLNVSIFTADHEATTLSRVVNEVKRFKAAFDSDSVRFQLASGNAGVMAATNEAVAAADHWVNWALFGAVTLLCLLTFRSLAITACVVLPLGLVTVHCYALMAQLGIGMKVNTLPVVALGVGVGVDYGIYLFEVMRHEMKSRGASLEQAFFEALRQRGTASLFTAVTMTIGVATWLLSDLKFQADMGILLAYMFLVNAFAAILVLPALAAFLVRPGKAKTEAQPV